MTVYTSPEINLGEIDREGFVRLTTGRLRMAQHAQTQSALGRKSAPFGQCGRASLLVDLAGDEMALLIEMVVDLGVN